MTAELVALTDELRATTTMLGTVVARLDEADKRSAELAAQAVGLARSTRRHRLGTWVLAAVVLAVTLLGWRDVQERDQAALAACQQANATRGDIRASIVDTVLVIIQGTEDPERLAPIVTRVQDRLDTTLPDRECQ